MAARRFSDFRPAASTAPTTQTDSIDQVLQRIASGRDGGLLLAWLREQTMEPSPPGATEAMLREADARRRAFNELLRLATA